MREWPVAIEFERLSGNTFPESLFCAGAVEEGRGCWVFSAVRVRSARPPGVLLGLFLSVLFFSPDRVIGRPMGAPPRRPHRGFCWVCVAKFSENPARHA